MYMFLSTQPRATPGQPETLSVASLALGTHSMALSDHNFGSSM